MITTIEKAPSPLLAPFVRCCTYREFDTKGADFVKPKHAVHEIAMHFFFQGIPVKLTNPFTGAIVKTGKTSGVSGISSQYVGEMTFNGFYSFFEIIFIPHGVRALFNIPAAEVLNLIVWNEELFGSNMQFLHEQFCYCSNMQQMAAIADAYLLKLLQKQGCINDTRMPHIIHYINNRKGRVNIDALAADANMSIRNFERRFIEQTGIPAKLFCCIAGFNHAMGMKLQNPHLHWASIAYDTGYFDQMHLIKDF